MKMHTIEFDTDSVSALFALKHLLHSNLFDEEEEEEGEDDDFDNVQ